MDTPEVVELPSLQFTVKSSTLAASTLGVQRGVLTLTCLVRDEALWDAAVAKMDGYTVFSSTMDEILDALGLELTEQVNEAKALKRSVLRLQRELAEKDRTIQGLRYSMSVLESDLGF